MVLKPYQTLLEQTDKSHVSENLQENLGSSFLPSFLDTQTTENYLNQVRLVYEQLLCACLAHVW